MIQFLFKIIRDVFILLILFCILMAVIICEPIEKLYLYVKKTQTDS